MSPNENPNEDINIENENPNEDIDIENGQCCCGEYDCPDEYFHWSKGF